jgi:branched-chain amino acid transport system substrate-binding protein
VYLTFAGLDQSSLLELGGAGADLVNAYKEQYGEDPVGSYPLYGVAAMQVILQAIEKSDGTRAGVNNAVFSGEGITIPADQSVIGKEIKIDPATGDSNNRDISVLIMKGGAETLVKPVQL